MPNNPPQAEIKWFHDEIKRGWVALGLAAVPTVVAVGLLNQRLYGAWMTMLTVAMFAWTFSGLAYSAMTWRAFRGINGPQLRTVVQIRHRRTGLARIMQGSEDGPESAVVLSAIAFLGAAILPRVSLLTRGSGQSILSGLAVAVVAVSWLTVVISYAVYYARLYTQHRGLDFPGRDDPVFSDFLYFALMVSTTFGTTDVTVDSSRTRSAVSGHSFLAFLFNTVILAMMVGALGSL